MKTIRPTIVLAVLLTGLATVAFGQEKLDALMNQTTPEERAQFQTDYMKESLSLTSDQESKIYALNLKHAKEMQVTYNASDRKIQKLKKMKSINEQKEQELKSILDADQYAAYERNKDDMKEKLRARNKGQRKDQN
jgi:hypothetical protein